MNQCENIRAELSAMIDDELSLEQTQLVQQHLRNCTKCQDEWTSHQELHRRLTNMLVIDEMPEKISRVEAKWEHDAASTETMEVNQNERQWIRRVLTVLAIAASIGFAIFMLRPVDDVANTPNLVEPMFAARLVNATGPIEIKIDGSVEWTTVHPSATASLKNGSRIRTSEWSQCELQTADSGTIRMDRGSEVLVSDSQQWELLSGQLWCAASENHAMQIRAPIVKDNQTVSIPVFGCPSSSSLQCSVAELTARCSTPADSKSHSEAMIQVGNETLRVGAGETVTINARQEITRTFQQGDNDAWQLPLLALSRGSRRELHDSIQRLIAPIGMTKARHMNETQIRALGPAGAIPLLSYVSEQPDEKDKFLRHTAMRLAVASADRSATALLTRLTSDSDQYIANQAQQALVRIQK